MIAKNNITKNKRYFFEAVEPVLIRFGFRKTTLNDILRAANVPRNKFMELFENKRDFFIQISLYTVEGLIEQWEKGISSELNDTEKIESFIDYYITKAIRHPLFGIIIKEIEFPCSRDTEGLDICLTPLIETLRKIIDQGCNNKRFRKQNTDFIAKMILSLLYYIYLLRARYFNICDDSEKIESLKELKDSY